MTEMLGDLIGKTIRVNRLSGVFTFKPKEAIILEISNSRERLNFITNLGIYSIDYSDNLGSYVAIIDLLNQYNFDITEIKRRFHGLYIDHGDDEFIKNLSI